MEEDKIIPQPRAGLETHNVNWMKNRVLKNINDPQGYEFDYMTTDSNTGGDFPEELGWADTAIPHEDTKNMHDRVGITFCIMNVNDAYNNLEIGKKPFYQQYWYSSKYGWTFSRTIQKTYPNVFVCSKWERAGTDESRLFIKPEKAWFISNINEIKNSGIQATNENSTGDFPDNIPPEHRHGMLQTFMINAGTNGQQTWTAHDGEREGNIYVRTMKAQQWQSWHKVGTTTGGGGSPSIDDSHFFKKPEFQEKMGGNIDNFKTSGIYRLDETKLNAGTKPPLATSKWAILLVFVENEAPESAVAVYQMWLAVHGSERGAIFTRTYSGQNWSEWVTAGGGGTPVLPDEYFPATDREPITDANSFVSNGFKRTTTATAGLPDDVNGADIDGRDGIIQFISENVAGEQTGVQYFIPIQGLHAGRTYTRVRQNVEVQTRSGERIVQHKWSEWNADSSNSNDVNINYNNVNTTTSPTEFLISGKQKFKQKVFYNYFWKNALTDSTIPDDVTSEDFIVRTMVLASPEQQERNHQFVEQTAFGKDGEILVRTSKEVSTGNYQWNHWHDIRNKPTGEEIDFTKWVTFE